MKQNYEGFTFNETKIVAITINFWWLFFYVLGGVLLRPH